MTSKYKSSATIYPLNQAVGKILAHDITEIRPGQFKGPAFKKGHVVREADLAHLRRLGKEHLLALHLAPGELHEDEAAKRLAAALTGPGLFSDQAPAEGKIALKAAHRGMLKVDRGALTEINMVPDISCASRHNNALVEEGEIVAATRAIPLIIDEIMVNRAEAIAETAGGIFTVKPLTRPRTGIIITGNEVFTGLIDDKFAPLLRKKLRFFDCEVGKVLFAPDQIPEIGGAIQALLADGSELILAAGGMSVDPDDITRLAIAEAGAEDVVYGTPLLPGAMFLYGRIGAVPVLGLPACVLFYRATILDLVLPRILAGESITRRDLAEMAHGGLCLNCEECRYPVCPFGK